MKRVLIDYHGDAVRTACMSDNKLTEIYIDYKDGGSLVGHIINGVVKNVLPSRFTFIDIGQEKNAFMNLPAGLTLKPGQIIPVQVRKDAAGEKGPNVSPVLQFKGRLAILHPIQNLSREIGISGKIADKAERKRLHQLAAKHIPPGYSCILRTQCVGASEEALQMEFDYLSSLCGEVLKTARYSLASKVLYRDDLILNDLLTDDIEEIILNDEENFSYIKKTPFAEKARLWHEDTKLFDAFGIEQQIKKALQRNVWLPSGGFVTFDTVEACIVVDVNSGKFSGKKNYHETVMKVNIEAAKCIAEQITLRNLSGMIIIDFIDMSKEEDQNKLLTAFREALKTSRIPTDIVGITALGLVQLTRRKQRKTLGQLLQQPCPHCGGTGLITKS